MTGIRSGRRSSSRQIVLEVARVTEPPIAAQNSVLSHLPAATLARLQPKLQHVQLKRHQVLQEAHRPIDRVYFLQRGMAVLSARTRRDGEVGVAIIGRLGLVGVPAVLGTMRSPQRCVMEIPGEALQIGSGDLRRAMDESPSLRQQLMNYVQALLIQNTQTALCNARHNLEERLARWLLLTQDRLDGDTIPLTHDLLAMMLGVRRAGITTALEQLERSGAVLRMRGAVEIADRAQLEQWTCECYRIIATEYQRLTDSGRSERAVERDGSRMASAE
jgi:CRP-like cAMP-binding protein